MKKQHTPNKTNLEGVKEIAKLLYMAVEIKPNEIVPFIVNHPFIESTHVQIEGKGFDLLDITKEENAKMAQEMWFRRFDEATSIHDITCHVSKPYRLTFLKYAKEYLSLADFSSYLAESWVTSENGNNDVNCSLKEIVSWFRKADKKALMGEEDYEIYNNFPETFTVYRGVAVGRVKNGLSWTRNLKTAQWFANRWGKKGYIQKAEISKENALAYLNSRGEDEVVVDVFAIKNNIVRMEAEGDAE